MYEPSKHYATFNIRGMQFSESALVVGSLKVGDKLKLVPEFDNPFDSQAIAVYTGKTSLGYVPREMNELLSMFLYYGYEDAFTCRILAINLIEHPAKQITAAIYIKDARKK
ncbi:HIRAN domain-containing protein [Gordonibacter sp.]|uniref:HIRAN domain-containing protein n=1 Tax=Gordonibacter sp. TaxID=1968902 RepID=UPI002FCBE864